MAASDQTDPQQDWAASKEPSRRPSSRCMSAGLICRQMCFFRKGWPTRDLGTIHSPMWTIRITCVETAGAPVSELQLFCCGWRAAQMWGGDLMVNSDGQRIPHCPCRTKGTLVHACATQGRMASASCKLLLISRLLLATYRITKLTGCKMHKPGGADVQNIPICCGLIV